MEGVHHNLFSRGQLHKVWVKGEIMVHPMQHHSPITEPVIKADIRIRGVDPHLVTAVAPATETAARKGVVFQGGNLATLMTI